MAEGGGVGEEDGDEEAAEGEEDAEAEGAEALVDFEGGDDAEGGSMLAQIKKKAMKSGKDRERNALTSHCWRPRRRRGVGEQ